MPDQPHIKWVASQQPSRTVVGYDERMATRQTSHNKGDNKDNDFDMGVDPSGSDTSQKDVAGHDRNEKTSGSQCASLSDVDEWINSNIQPFNYTLLSSQSLNRGLGSLKRGLDVDVDNIDLDQGLKKRASEHSRKVVSDEATPERFEWPSSYASPGLDGLFLTPNKTWSENDFHLGSPKITPNEDYLPETNDPADLLDARYEAADTPQDETRKDAVYEHSSTAEPGSDPSDGHSRGVKRVACPWRQSDPQGHPECAQGFSDWSKLREHIGRAHLISRAVCPNCKEPAWVPLKGKKNYFNGSQDCHHEKDYDESRWVEKAMHEATFKKLDQKVKARRRQHQPLTDEDKWNFIYLKFIPHADHNNLPSYVHVSTNEHNVSAIEKELKVSARDLLGELEKIFGKMTFQTRHEVQNAIQKCTKNVTAVFRGVKQASAAVSPNMRRMSNAPITPIAVDIKDSSEGANKTLEHIKTLGIVDNHIQMEEVLSDSAGTSLPPPAWSYQETHLTPMTSVPSRARPAQDAEDVMFKHEKF